MNGQIVLCKGVNDGEELERSIRDLTGYLPYLRSVSVVPVGLTKFRDGLYPLEPFTKEDAKEVLRVIHKWQIRYMRFMGFISSMQGMSGISWPGRNCPGRKDTTVIYSWITAWVCCAC